MGDSLGDILQQLRASRFSDLAGARATATLPVPEAVVNRLVAASLPPNAPVRTISIHPEAADHFSVRIAPRAALMPALTLKLAIDAQPRMPDNPVLALRMVTLGGLFGLASGAIAGMLPAGVRLEGDRIMVDLAALARNHGQGEWLAYLAGLQIRTETGRLVLHIDAAVR